MFHRTNHCLACVGYVYVGRIYQNSDETLLGWGHVCFGDFKYKHWLPEFAYSALNAFSDNNVPYDFISPLFSITNFFNISFNDLIFVYYYSIASICPPKKNVISTLVLRALFTGTCVSLINACVAGKQSVIIQICFNVLPTPQLHVFLWLSGRALR